MKYLLLAVHLHLLFRQHGVGQAIASLQADDVIAPNARDGTSQNCVFLLLVLALTKPLGIYMFRVFGIEPGQATTWTEGAVYAVPKDGFRREWGHEWLASAEVTPVLCVLVQPEDFPLRHIVRAG